MRRLFILALVLSAVALPGQGFAAFSAEEDHKNPLARFTRSLAQLDRVSGLCRDIETARYENYSLLIRRYVKLMYDGAVPYWVLSEVQTRVNDHMACKWMVSESLIHYQYAYQDYVEVAKPKLLPPVLTESMAQFSSEMIDKMTLGIAHPSKH